MSEQTKRIEKRARRSIFQAFLDAARKYGGETKAATDGDGKTYTYKEITRASFALGGALARLTKKNETVGIMLPTGVGSVFSLFALLSRRRIPAMLNFAAGAKNIIAACEISQVKRVVTARKFIEIGNLESLVETLSDHVEFIYLEDVREMVSARDKALAVVGPIFPKLFAANAHYNDTGVILFTSGTEGAPKGVALSHRNIIANTEQISDHVKVLPTDIFFNPLPTFHCYGLTAGAIWPLLSGHAAVFHPSPLQTKIIAKRIFETGSTVLFATDTFLSQYMRASEDGGMSSLRLAVCGAERVRDETRQAAEKRFDFEVLEGYGVTEGAPVLAANQPGDIRAGTVGQLLPGVEKRLEPVEGLEGAERLFVRGPNIMKGYLVAGEPGVIKELEGGWHDTGDVVSFDKHGYMSIRGRIKRFAKIGGEMVSLAVVENCASALWPDNLHAAAIMPDVRKGEKIILVTDRQNAPRGLLLSWAQSHGVPEIAVPKKIVVVDEIPVLGTGKIDYVKVSKLAVDGLARLDGEGAATTGEPEAHTDDMREGETSAPENATDEPGDVSIETPVDMSADNATATDTETSEETSENDRTDGSQRDHQEPPAGMLDDVETANAEAAPDPSEKNLDAKDPPQSDDEIDPDMRKAAE
ncbi:MAG: AMP-binding protein [Pseudomonadota bacterium]